MTRSAQSTASLFARATRPPDREDRLTETFAGVLERVPELAWDLVEAWLTPAAAAGERSVAHPLFAAAVRDATRVSVATQVAVDGNYVDLELRFGLGAHRSVDDVTLWVEVKHGAAPHENQLQNYVTSARDRTDRRIVVMLLAPRGLLPLDPPQVPSEVTQRTWQSVSRRVASHKTADPVESFLLEELLHYMTDQGLAAPAALRPEHLLALSIADEADNALIAVCERVDAVLTAQRGKPDHYQPAPRTRSGQKGFGWDFWELWKVDAESDLSWDAYNEPGHPEADGRSLFFMAGLGSDTLAGLRVPEPAVERQSRLEAGVKVGGFALRFKRISEPGGRERFCVVAYPEEVLVGRSLEEQADRLAAWVSAAFDALTRPLEQL